MASGKFNHFQNGSIYWTSGTWRVGCERRDSHEMAALGWERGPNGYPTTAKTLFRAALYNHFQNGSIYWSPATVRIRFWVHSYEVVESRLGK